jgi:cell division septal protein FtsQ
VTSTTAEAPRVDPRLRARRIEVKREQGHRRLRRVVVALAVVSVLFGGLWVSRSSLLDVDRIEVYGLDQVSLGSVEEAIGIELGTPLVTLDTAGAARALEALPFVDEATVKRSWRGTITIEVTERRGVALALTAPDAWVLVDRHGRVLSEALAQLPALPRLSGVRAAGAPGSFMSEDSAAPLAVAQALPPALREVVYGVWRDDRGELRLGVEDGPMVLLGDDDRLRAKVAAAATMLDQLATEGLAPAILDVSVPNLPIVRQ